MKHRLVILVNRIRHSLGGEDVVFEGAGLQQETNCDLYVYGTVNQACIFIIQKMATQEEIGIGDLVLLDEITLEKIVDNLRVR